MRMRRDVSALRATRLAVIAMPDYPNEAGKIRPRGLR
jgi:hypothetical protein